MENSKENLIPQQSSGPSNSGGNYGPLGSLWMFVWDFLKVFLIALAIIIPVRFYLFQPFIVTGQSMLPTFRDGEYLIIDEISYHLTDPKRGEVVVLKSLQYPNQYLIKRIIGLPGETLDIANGKIVIKNKSYPQGTTLKEDYLDGNITTFGNIHTELGADQYYMLGDNRIASSDSRVFGPIRRGDIVGRVFVRAYPFARIDAFHSPEYKF